jgi:hypothetical protein
VLSDRLKESRDPVGPTWPLSAFSTIDEIFRKQTSEVGTPALRKPEHTEFCSSKRPGKVLWQSLHKSPTLSAPPNAFYIISKARFMGGPPATAAPR